ncbi:hypothetical protein BCR44DRAFT_37808 [Catenaria anguillulae PL171]|uniref:Uncharacterized protein n=1 Tax=Catenaria anguillulae PL171 TaxID=765915 RepID=A0A1Y2H6A5_9FUNG|nr:hypothetical protein BCR44DRAFT_37808 [Catenaria anguillulae PL171]
MSAWPAARPAGGRRWSNQPKEVFQNRKLHASVPFALTTACNRRKRRHIAQQQLFKRNSRGRLALAAIMAYTAILYLQVSLLRECFPSLHAGSRLRIAKGSSKRRRFFNPQSMSAKAFKVEMFKCMRDNVDSLPESLAHSKSLRTGGTKIHIRETR